MGRSSAMPARSPRLSTPSWLRSTRLGAFRQSPVRVMTSCGNARGNIQQSRAGILGPMITTLRTNFRDPVRRKMFGARLGGKFIGVALVVGIIYAFAYLLSTEAASAMPLHSQAVSVKEQLTGTINGLNTAWVLLTAFLVFFMQAGFMMLEGGFARTREVSNIMIECIVDTALCGIIFYAFGFALMFGPGNGWVGYHYFFLQDIPHTYTYGGSFDTGVAFLAFFLFQFAFADTASTIVSGAMVGRTSFKGDLLYSVVVSGLIYPIFGHWIWGPGGWLATMETPFRDFAGSTVVHTIGGVLAICGAIALGPRLGRKFKRDGGGMPPGPNMTLAACAGALVAVAWVYPRSKKWDVGISINGLLAGLVAITCPCYWVSPTGSIAIGAIAGAVMILFVDFTEWVRVDDPCGAFAVHGACGIWGTLSLGLFAVGNYGDVKGLLYGGNANQLIAQIEGSATIIACTAAAGLLLMFGLKFMGVLRISEAEELEGLDIAEHGAPAYHPEYAYMGYSPIPSNLEGVAPGLSVATAPPSDIHLPASE